MKRPPLAAAIFLLLNLFDLGECGKGSSPAGSGNKHYAQPPSQELIPQDDGGKSAQKSFLGPIVGLTGNIMSSSSSKSDDVFEKAQEVLFADSQSHQNVKLQGKGKPSHLLFKFQDLQPWTHESKHAKPGRGGEESRRKSSSGSSIILDLRRYNPLTSHLLAQSYVYPASNGLTQADRDYFAMIQSETGLSDVHFEPTRHPSIKEELLDTRQLQVDGHKDDSHTDKTQHSSTTTQAKPLPRFVYHRVPGSFAAFRVIKPALTSPTMSYDSFHDDEPPNYIQVGRPSRDVAAVHLI